MTVSYFQTGLNVLSGLAQTPRANRNIFLKAARAAAIESSAKLPTAKTWSSENFQTLPGCVHGWYDESVICTIMELEELNLKGNFRMKIEPYTGKNENHWIANIHIQKKDCPESNITSLLFDPFADTQSGESQLSNTAKTINYDNLTPPRDTNFIANTQIYQYNTKDCGPITLQLIQEVLRDPKAFYECSTSDDFNRLITRSLGITNPKTAQQKAQIFRKNHIEKIFQNTTPNPLESTAEKKINLITFSFSVAVLSTMALIVSCFFMGATLTNFLPYLAIILLNDACFHLRLESIKLNDDLENFKHCPITTAQRVVMPSEVVLHEIDETPSPPGFTNTSEQPHNLSTG